MFANNKSPIDGLSYEVEKNGVVTKVLLSDVIASNDMWKSGRAKVISLVGLQKIANKEGIVEKKFEMPIVPTSGNKQQHGVNIWVGFAKDTDPDNWRRGSGEASQFNTGKIRMDKVVVKDPKTMKEVIKEKRVYEEVEHIDSKFRFAMADKRAYC